MKAVLLLRRRVVVAADAFVEVVVWRVPEPVAPSPHHFEYRLAYVVAGQCVQRHDNERGKGDHRHIGETEESHEFATPERLMADFAADIERWNHENGRPRGPIARRHSGRCRPGDGGRAHILPLQPGGGPAPTEPEA